MCPGHNYSSVSGESLRLCPGHNYSIIAATREVGYGHVCVGDAQVDTCGWWQVAAAQLAGVSGIASPVPH